MAHTNTRLANKAAWCAQLAHLVQRLVQLHNHAAMGHIHFLAMPTVKHAQEGTGMGTFILLELIQALYTSTTFSIFIFMK